MSDKARLASSSGVGPESTLDRVTDLADTLESTLRVRRAALEALERELSEFLMQEAAGGRPLRNH